MSDKVKLAAFKDLLDELGFSLAPSGDYVLDERYARDHTDQEQRAFTPTSLAASVPIAGSIKQNIAKEKVAIDHELSVLHSTVERAHQLISQIEAAVAPVSTPVPPSEGGLPSHEVVGSSRVYNAIHEAATALHFLEDRANTILRNLEV